MGGLQDPQDGGEPQITPTLQLNQSDPTNPVDPIFHRHVEFCSDNIRKHTCIYYKEWLKLNTHCYAESYKK